MKITGLFSVLVLATVSHLSAATQAYLGYLELFGDTSNGFQEVKFFDTTGASALGGNCNTASVGGPDYICDGINIVNWTINVQYLDATSTPQTGSNDSTTCSGTGCDTIQPYLAQGGDGTILFSIPYTSGTCPACFTHITVTGTIPSSFNAYDPVAASTLLFQAVTPFTADWTVGSTPGDGPFDSFDVLVDSNPNPGGGGNGGGVPEPASIALMLGGLLTVGARRYFVR